MTSKSTSGVIVERFERHASGHGTVADDGDVFAVHALLTRRHGHAQRGRDAGTGVRRAKGIELGLRTSGKTGNPAMLAQGRHLIAPAGQNLVWIGLVPDIPDDAVIWRVEHIMQSQREFHCSQVG
jgi:hypothetical protein